MISLQGLIDSTEVGWGGPEYNLLLLLSVDRIGCKPMQGDFGFLAGIFNNRE